MDTLQGQPEPTPAVPEVQGQPAPASAGSVSPDLQQFVATEPATAPTVPEGQGLPQGQPPQTGAPQPDTFHQRLADQRQAEIYRLQQELQMERTRHAPPPPEPAKNPYDPQTQWEQWDNWRLAQISQKATQDALMGVFAFAQQQTQVQKEQSWQATHPQVPIEAVKLFARQNGIAEWNLDAAYTLMNLPNNMAQVASAQATQLLNDNRQPIPGALPVRGSPTGVPTEVGMSYDKLAAEFQRTNGRVYNTWPKELQQAFDRETNIRYANLR